MRRTAADRLRARTSLRHTRALRAGGLPAAVAAIATTGRGTVHDFQRPKPMPRPYPLLRRCALAALLLAAHPAAAQERAAARDPILFVHGWRGRGEQWREMIRRFTDDGWSSARLFALTLDPRESNAAAAARVAGRVDQVLVATGASRVDIVSHSMGSLSTRYYLKRLDGADKVDAWVSLAGPNHGIHMAELCLAADCREMRRASPFLAALNAGDETPGRARFATWRSPCDEIIDPVDTVILAGAENHLAGCISHLGFLRDPAVYRAVRDFVAR